MSAKILFHLAWMMTRTLLTIRRILNQYQAGHILSRIYNCTKHGNRPIDNAKNAHVFTAHFDFTTAQIVIICTLKYVLVPRTSLLVKMYAPVV